LWLVPLDGKVKPVQLEVRGTNFAQTWSEDGSKLAFVSARGDHSFIGLFTPVAKSVSSLADAEDAAQEALMRAWRAWPTLREEGAARAWLLRITTNVCRNWQTGRFGFQRRATQSLDDSDSQALLRRTGVSGPGNGAHTDALDLRHAIAALSDDLRWVVALRFYAGMDATEIGELLETPPATIRTRLRRALTLLRDALDTTADGDTSAWASSMRTAPRTPSPVFKPERNA
jgi:RNA polymerase sigma-70 factor (ECF subfamily)